MASTDSGAAQPGSPAAATTFAMRPLPSRFERGDLVIVRSSPERLASGATGCDHFWIAIVSEDYHAKHRRDRVYIKVRWWQTQGYPDCSHPNHPGTQYEFGLSDRIEVLTTLCVVRHAPELLSPGQGPVQLSALEWDAAIKAVSLSRAASAHELDSDGDDGEEAEGSSTSPRGAQNLKNILSPAIVHQVQPICGLRGEWCDPATPDTEFDVRDRYGRWYGAMVLNGHVGDFGESVRLALRAWDGRVKSEIVLPKSSMGSDIAPAGSRLLTHASHVKYEGRLLSPFETKALQNGTRVSVMWDVKSPTDWYEAVATKTGKHSRNSDWDAWYQLDFDGFDTGMQYFDLHKLAASKRLRLADLANQTSFARKSDSEQENLSAFDVPQKLSQQELVQMCTSGELLYRRIAGLWSFYGTHYKGTVIRCERQCLICRYDDGDELVEDAEEKQIYLLPPSPPVAKADSDASTETREFPAGFVLEYACASRDGEVWLRGKVVAPTPRWPGWYRVALEINMSSTGACVLGNSGSGSGLPTAVVEKEVLLRAANEDIAWRRPGIRPRYHESAGNAGRGLRAFNGRHSSVVQALISPAPTWGRVVPLDTCSCSDGDKKRSKLPQQRLYLPDGSVCGVGDTLTICDTQSEKQSENCSVPIVKICKIIKGSSTQQEDAVEVQWLRRGSETCLRDSWSGSSQELFLCTERHQLPAAMLSARCVVLYGTRSSIAHRRRNQTADSNVHFCHLSYDAERAAFVDLHEVAERESVSPPSGTRRKAKCSSAAPVSGMDLYCGAGGLTEGLRMAGIQTMHGVESDRDAAAAWQLNNRDSTVWHSTCQDLLDRIQQGEPGLPEVGSLDVLSMGPPCQGFTSLGHQCENDERNRQELQVGLAFTLHMRPKVVICENVPGLLAAQHLDSLRIFISGLVSSGYQVHCKLLNAAHYGVPSTRTRLFVVGALTGCRLPSFPAPTHCFGNSVDAPTAETLPIANPADDVGERKRLRLQSTPTVRDALAGLPQLQMEEGQPLREMIWMDSHTSCLDLAPTEKQQDADRKGDTANLDEACGERRTELGEFSQWCRQDAPAYIHNHTVALVSDAVSSVATGCPDLDQPATTVLTKPSPRWFCRHPTQQGRYLSPREVARLQSFPDRLRLWGHQQAHYRQVGNAVPVRLAEALGREIVRALTGRSGSSKSGTVPVQKRTGKKRAEGKVKPQVKKALKRPAASGVIDESMKRPRARAAVVTIDLTTPELELPSSGAIRAAGRHSNAQETPSAATSLPRPLISSRLQAGGHSNVQDSTSAATSLRRPSVHIQNLPTLPAGQEMLNRRVEIWWGGDAEWYAGTVTAYNEASQLYTILYDDGVSKITDLSCAVKTPCRVIDTE
jgi:DNA (cytosine-5)-methyltransferase 1